MIGISYYYIITKILCENTPMSNFNRLVILSMLFLIVSCGNNDHGEPSAAAKDMPGAEGTFSFEPGDFKEGETSWWKDSDGVKPGVAGCHIGTDDKGVPNGRKFGEVCLENGFLVESNPGKDELHSHGNDTGHPDTFDCNAWCVGNGNKSGSCQVAQAPPCDSSAICACE